MARVVDDDKRVGGLTITRKVGEIISINHGEIIIQVVLLKDSEVRLSFKADPAKVKIQRAEIAHLYPKGWQKQ